MPGLIFKLRLLKNSFFVTNKVMIYKIKLFSQQQEVIIHNNKNQEQITVNIKPSLIYRPHFLSLRDNSK